MLRTTTRHRRSVVGGLLALLALLTTGVPAAHAQGGTDPAEAWYTTDFSNPSAAAVEWQFPDGQTTETGKGYTLAITPGAFTVGLDGAKNFWITPNVAAPPADQIVETTIAETTGDRSVLAGVVCRGSLDRDLGYGFLVANDGYYVIGAYAGPGVRRLVNAKGSKRTRAIDPTGPNTVRAECKSVGKTKVRLTMFVNDEQVASVVDSTSPTKTARDAYLLSEVAKGKSAQVTYSSFSITPA